MEEPQNKTFEKKKGEQKKNSDLVLSLPTSSKRVEKRKIQFGVRYAISRGCFPPAGGPGVSPRGASKCPQPRSVKNSPSAVNFNSQLDFKGTVFKNPKKQEKTVKAF